MILSDPEQCNIFMNVSFVDMKFCGKCIELRLEAEGWLVANFNRSKCARLILNKDLE